MPWDRVHDEAEVLEHVLSEELEELIAAKLGNPTHDPHGDPIPNAELEIEERPTQASRRWRPARAACSCASRTRTRACCATSRELGITPGDRFEIVDRQPFGGPLFARFDGQRARARRRARGRDARRGRLGTLDAARQPAVDQQVDAGHVGRALRAQERDHVAQLVGARPGARPGCRAAGCARSSSSDVPAMLAIRSVAMRPGRDAVQQDAVPPELPRQRLERARPPPAGGCWRASGPGSAPWSRSR